MAIDVDDLLVSLGIRLEDEAESEHTEAKKLEALNDAQLQLASLLDRHYLTELETVKNTFSLPSGRGALTAAGLGATPLNGAASIVRVKVQGEWINPIDPDNLEQTRNYYCEPTVTDARWYVSDGYLYVLPNTISSANKVVFLKVPETLISGGECVFNDGLRDILLGLAEVIRWRGEESLERTAAIEKTVYAQIAAMNAKYKTRG